MLQGKKKGGHHALRMCVVLADIFSTFPFTYPRTRKRGDGVFGCRSQEALGSLVFWGYRLRWLWGCGPLGSVSEASQKPWRRCCRRWRCATSARRSVCGPSLSVIVVHIRREVFSHEAKRRVSLGHRQCTKIDRTFFFRICLINFFRLRRRSLALRSP